MGPGYPKCIVEIDASTTFTNIGMLQTKNMAVKIATVIEAWRNRHLDLVLSDPDRRLVIFLVELSFIIVTMKLRNVKIMRRRMFVASRKY